MLRDQKVPGWDAPETGGTRPCPRNFVSGYLTSLPLRLAELHNEFIRMAAARRVEYLGGTRIVGVGQDLALSLELEPRSLDFPPHRRRLDPVQCVRDVSRSPGHRRVIQHHVDSAGLQRIVHSLVERGCVD